jgi:hypothetical protein
MKARPEKALTKAWPEKAPMMAQLKKALTKAWLEKAPMKTSTRVGRE